MGIQNSIQPVIGEWFARAEAAGYDPRHAIERLAYGSFVSAAHRYFYMETPKAASTSIKHLIACLEGVAPETGALPYQRETRLDMLVHQRRHIAVASLVNAPAATQQAVLARAPDWMIFALARNPFSRLVSFFENKIRLGEPGYRHLEAHYGDPARHGSLRGSFGAFVKEVVAERALQRGDSHLMTQSDLIMPRLIPYTHIFRTEAADDAVAALRAHLAKNLPHAPAIARNRSPARDWRGYYDEASAAIVAKAYEEDFALFGYDPHDWQGSGAGPESSAEKEHWRQELIARNAMIDRLYSHLGVPPAGNAAESRLIPKTAGFTKAS